MVTVVTLDAPPMVIVEKEKLTGMAVELAQKAFERAGYVPKIQIAPWSRAVYMTKHGLADALFYAVYNDERAQYFYYPDSSLFTIDLVALKRKGTDIVIAPNAPSLKRWVLGIGRGFAYGPKFFKFIERAEFKKVEETASNDLNFKKLLDHRIDMLVADKALARYFLEQPETQGRAEYVRDEKGRVAIFDSMDAFMVFSKEASSAEDARRFSDALETMKYDGTYHSIVDRYQ